MGDFSQDFRPFLIIEDKPQREWPDYLICSTEAETIS